jgi:geranylgeranyl diphosphate synthase type II
MSACLARPLNEHEETARRRGEGFLRYARDRVNHALDGLLPSVQEMPEEMHKAERYSVFAGGKRLRPALCLAAYEACGGEGDAILPAACALELVHTFSLIHDDLPCMDDDDLRRGRATNHRVFGEAMAVLSGDALLVQAFEWIARTGRVECALTLAESLGSKGMLRGQVLDLQGEGRAASVDEVECIHNHKTAALIAGSLTIGAQMADASTSVVQGLRDFGYGIGLGFQIIDDCLDLEQTTEVLGKDAKSDLAKRKATYPSVVGIADSRRRASSLVVDAIRLLRTLPIEGEGLESIAQFVLARTH